METRKSKPSAAAASQPYEQLSAREGELDAIQRKMLEKESQLQAQAEMLRQQSLELETVKRKLNEERDDVNARENELSVRERELSKKWADSYVMTEIREDPPRDTLQIATDHARQMLPPEISPANNYAYEMYPPMVGNDSGHNNIAGPKVSFREITDFVPSFNGYNISLQQFTRACRRARELVPPSAERNLTKLLINRLSGRAYYAVEDEPCETVIQLTDLLTTAFGSPKTIDQYRGELSTIYLKPNEHILDFISRVKDIRTAIIDAERRIKVRLDPRFVADIDNLATRSFCDGLPLPYRLQMRIESYRQPADAFAVAKEIAKRQELDKSRYEPVSGYNGISKPQRVTPIGSPRAHSTPYRTEPPQPRFSARNPPNRSEFPRRDFVNQERESRSFGESPRQGQRSEEVGRYRSEPPRGNSNKICRYCKNVGHEIEECRKRQYNNARKSETGNANGPPNHSGASRPDPSRVTRPVNPIAVEEASEEEESQS